jgi:hypothetical protein
LVSKSFVDDCNSKNDVNAGRREEAERADTRGKQLFIYPEDITHNYVVAAALDARSCKATSACDEVTMRGLFPKTQETENLLCGITKSMNYVPCSHPAASAALVNKEEQRARSLVCSLPAPET